MHRHQQNRRIRDNIRYRIADEQSSEIDTLPRHSRIICRGNRRALEDAHEDEDERPDYGYPAEDPCSDFERAESEDAAVHDENGDFDEREVDEVDWFVTIKELYCEC